MKSSILPMLFLIFLLPNHKSFSQFKLQLEGNLSENEYAVAGPLQVNFEVSTGNRDRFSIKIGAAGSVKSSFKYSFPVTLNWTFTSNSKNTFSSGVGCVLLLTERIPPYNTSQKSDFGPSGIIIPIQYKRQLTQNWFTFFTINTFLSFESSVFPSIGIEYAFKSNTSGKDQKQLN